MAEMREKYRRLPGRSSSISGRYSLWLGADHLLKLSNSGYTEDYRRFYLKDIQAIAVARTKWFEFTLAILIVLAIVFGGIGYSIAIGTPLMPVSTGGFASPFVLLIAVNLILGPTCICRVRTAVQDDQLPNVARLRSARKMMAIVGPLILAAQAAEFPAAPALEVAQAAPMSPIEAALTAPQAAAPAEPQVEPSLGAIESPPQEP